MLIITSVLVLEKAEILVLLDVHSEEASIDEPIDIGMETELVSLCSPSEVRVGVEVTGMGAVPLGEDGSFSVKAGLLELPLLALPLSRSALNLLDLALLDLAVQDFIGEANFFPTARLGSLLVASLLGKCLLHTL